MIRNRRKYYRHVTYSITLARAKTTHDNAGRAYRIKSIDWYSRVDNEQNIESVINYRHLIGSLCAGTLSVSCVRLYEPPHTTAKCRKNVSKNTCALFYSLTASYKKRHVVLIHQCHEQINNAYFRSRWKKNIDFSRTWETSVNARSRPKQQ